MSTGTSSPSPRLRSVAPPVPMMLRALDRVFPPDRQTFMSSEQQTKHEIVKAAGTMGTYLSEIGYEHAASLDVLDFGCGWGGETLWLADRVRSVTGIDVDRNAIDVAQVAARDVGASNCRFVCSDDGTLPFPDCSFDAAFSTDTLEHVMNLDRAFGEIRRVLRPGGSFLTRFGPLFYSPHGYHLYWACQVPYAHLIFGLNAIVAIREQRGGASRTVRTWQDLGLNAKRAHEFRAAITRAGLEIDRCHAIPVRGTKICTVIPKVRDLFIFGIDAHLRRPR